jgi:hypothetical protein
MKYIRLILAILLLSVSSYAVEPPDDLVALLDQVAMLQIERNGYILGKALTDTQKETAGRHPVNIDHPRLIKFKDGDLFIVTEKNNNRVIIIYEQQNDASQKTIQKLVGTFFLDYGDPTVFSHDKVIYWAWGKDGKISNHDYKLSKDKQKPLDVLATVKLNSHLKIMESQENQAPGRVYFIISSDPILKLIQPK